MNEKKCDNRFCQECELRVSFYVVIQISGVFLYFIKSNLYYSLSLLSES